MKKKLASVALTLPLAFSFATSAFAQSNVQLNDESNLGVYYELYVNSFYDSNKDGHGDLNGIIQKMDYLNDGNPHLKNSLDVNALWLMPIFPSPSYHKYDTIDFYNVDPQYGTLEDFHNFTAEAHKRGVKVILDIALNHSSNQNAWFKEAVKDKDSSYRNYYIWADENTDLNERGPWGQQLWHETYPGSGDYYYAVFDKVMPDLNFDNPKLREEMINVGKFWLNQGADGFRLDASLHIYTGDIDKNVSWWEEFRQSLKQVKPDVYLVGENWDRPQNIAPYFKSMDSSFNFDLGSKMLDAVKNGADNGLSKFEENCLYLYKKYSPDPIDAPFLTNHDQARTMSQLNGDVTKAKMAANLLLTMPGNPYLYYGEEIGMVGNGPDEIKREPFRWYTADGEGQTTWEPNVANTDASVSVEAETNDESSLLNHYRKMIHFRQASPALMKGDYYDFQTGDSRIISYKRTYQDDSIVVLNNVSNETATVQLSGKYKKLEFTTSDQVKLKHTKDGVEITIPASTTCGLK